MIDSVSRKYSLIVGFILFLSFIYIGCEQKSEKPETTTDGTDTAAVQVQPMDTAASDTAEMTEQDSTTDLTGKWTGTFDQRSTTLTIKEQNENKFSGTITISYRDPLTKQVSGEFNKETNEFSMTDTQHGRYKGKYKGKLEEGKISGTFTMDLDGKNYSFNLTKR